MSENALLQSYKYFKIFMNSYGSYHGWSKTLSAAKMWIFNHQTNDCRTLSSILTGFRGIFMGSGKTIDIYEVI